jgi:hypothetical protein
MIPKKRHFKTSLRGLRAQCMVVRLPSSVCGEISGDQATAIQRKVKRGVLRYDRKTADTRRIQP